MKKRIGGENFFGCMAISLQTALYTIARESCRDQADHDYVHARSAWRLMLRDQFLWSSQQAIEKYLKGVLLFNGQSARYVNRIGKNEKEFGHSLTKLSAAVDALPGFATAHPPWWQDFIERLEYLGQNRYLTRNTRTRFDALEMTDEAVWSVRRYCQRMRFSMKHPDGTVMDTLPEYMQTVNHPVHQARPTGYRIIGGQLERWLAAPRATPARQALIWNNRFFGGRARRTLRYARWSSFANAPVRRDWASDPSLRAELLKYFKFD